MTKLQIHPKSFTKHIEETDADALQKTDELHEILIRLRCEGKPSLEMNTKNLRRILKFFKKDLLDHMQVEEKVLFPFLERHVPRLEWTIRLLCAEHYDFKRDLNIFEHLLKRLGKEKSLQARTILIQKLHETGIMLIYLLRHHIEVESKGIFEAISVELNRREKEELERQVIKHERKEARVV